MKKTSNVIWLSVLSIVLAIVTLMLLDLASFNNSGILRLTLPNELCSSLVKDSTLDFKSLCQYDYELEHTTSGYYLTLNLVESICDIDILIALKSGIPLKVASVSFLVYNTFSLVFQLLAFTILSILLFVTLLVILFAFKFIHMIIFLDGNEQTVLTPEHTL